MDPIEQRMLIQRMPRGRGPWGMVQGDCWLADDSEIGRQVASEGQHFVVEIVVSQEDGKLTESFYTTDDPKLVARARAGRRLWEAQGRHSVSQEAE